MSANGEFREGFVPSGRPVIVEEIPIACLDGCHCDKHHTANACSCRWGYVCAYHLLLERLQVVYTGRFE